MVEGAMKQRTLRGFETHRKTTRRAQFLADMERIEPWTALQAAIEPVYPQGGEHGGLGAGPARSAHRNEMPVILTSALMT
jgi:hypothetical protein